MSGRKNRCLHFLGDNSEQIKSNYCCQDMAEHVLYPFDPQTCKDRFEDVDCLIHYEQMFDEYGIIIHDGGSSSIIIQFCPFCGTNLPESKRDMWFDELEDKGFDDPLEQDIPKAYYTDEWYKDSK